MTRVVPMIGLALAIAVWNIVKGLTSADSSPSLALSEQRHINVKHTMMVVGRYHLRQIFLSGKVFLSELMFFCAPALWVNLCRKKCLHINYAFNRLHAFPCVPRVCNHRPAASSLKKISKSQKMKVQTLNADNKHLIHALHYE